ncbi:MAG: ABC transporter substrate-binding protein, partial [Dehalococcoidia bacterium]|nr:ABC transporter substrate-binding protein [Dehalococcoidia bacterium]
MMRGLRLVMSALVVMMAGWLLASCSTTPPSPASSGTSTLDTKPYGSLTIAGNFGAGPLDPQFDSVTFNYVSGAIFDSLVYYDPDNRLKPGIAERWEISPDGMRHIFYIRKGVKFHDG